MKKKFFIPLFFMFSFFVFLNSCVSDQASAKSCEIDISTSFFSNDGQPFYCVIDEVDKGEFLTKTYEEVSRSVFSTEGDLPQHLLEVIIPGIDLKTRFHKPQKNKAIGIYFLFTNPSEEWKLFVEPSCSKVKIELGNNEIKSIQ